MGLRLGFHYHVPAMERDGQIWMPGYLAGFVDSLGEKVDRLWCFLHSPLPSEVPSCDVALTARNVELVSLGPHVSIPRRMMQSRHYVEVLEGVGSQMDALLIRGPSPLLPALGSAAWRLGVPVAMLLVGDYLKGVSTLPQPRWRMELIRAWSWWNKRGQGRLARHSLVFVNSRELFQEYEGLARRLIETRTTTLREFDFFERDDTCKGSPIRLLYTGRYDLAKGLLDILQAMAILVERGMEVEWHLVGWEYKGCSATKELWRRAASLGLKARVFDHGFKRVGPELLSMYREADLFIVASQLAEGFPRTIWESFASCTPVIATKVGSIPFFLEDGKHAVLVDPCNPHAIADAVERIVGDQRLRRSIIRGGFALASENTLDRRASEMTESLDVWLKQQVDR